MNSNPSFWAGKRVCVTGGTGFLGWNLVQELLPLAGHVRAFGLVPRSGTLRDLLQTVDCIHGDVRDPSAVRRAVSDCDVVFHTAGNVAVWGPALEQMRSIHCDGTRQVLAALAERARLVHTSSVVAVGGLTKLASPVLTEESPFELEHVQIDYVHAKKAAEDLALAAAERGQDVVVVNPGYLIGPNDYDRSIIGRFCVRCWRCKVPLIPPGGWNLVDVRDVARGHLLAAERGRAGRRYILGGTNLSMLEFVQRLAEVRGLSTRWWFRMPGWLYVTAACAAHVQAFFRKREPTPSLQHVRLNRYYWHFSSERALRELGYRARPLEDTLRDTHAWFCQLGKLKSVPPRLAA